MTIDITNTEHRKVLMCICDELVESTTRDERLDRATFAMPFGARGGEIFDTLSNPARTAELIRALIERAGVTAYDSFYDGTGEFIFVRHSVAGMDAFVYIGSTFDNRLGGNKMLYGCSAWAPIIGRLLSLPPNAGAKAVLAALRGEL